MSCEVEPLQKYSITNMNKSVEDLLISSHEVITSINSSSMGSQGSTSNLTNGPQQVDGTHNTSLGSVGSGGGGGGGGGGDRSSPISSPNLSPRLSPRFQHKREYARLNSDSTGRDSINTNKSDDQHSQDVVLRSLEAQEAGKSTHDIKKEARGDRSKKKTSWYSVLYPTYKSRSEDFKRIFKDVPDDERLVVDYSCALQREILAHGRLYVSQNYVCFYANIFSWETVVSLRWKDVTSITKEKTALVIPNAISICTESDKFFLTSFGARDKVYMMLFRVWQIALIGKPMSTSELWQLVHSCYGNELGLTSDDEDYVPSLPPTDEDKLSTRLSVESFSEPEVLGGESSAPTPPMEPLVEPEPQLLPQPPLKAELTLDPTDLSDTTESEAEKHGLKMGIRCLPVCTGSHEGRQVCKATLPLHIDQVFTLLYTKSKFFLDFHTARKTTDLVQSAWIQDNQTGQKMRTVTMTVALTQSIGPRTSQVTETQVMLPCSKPGYLYSIDVENVNAGIPYADSFSVLSHYCLTRVSEDETDFVVYSQIKYKKSVWAFIRNVIEKNCWSGLDEYLTSLVKAFMEEAEEGSSSGGIKRKARRRRRATGVGPTLHVHSPDQISPINQAITPELPHIHNNIVPGTRSDSNIILSSMLLIAVLCLMVINGLLYYKLWGLEEAAAYTIMDLHTLKDTPKTEEDWINLLQQQESLHNVEMRKWQRVLHTAAQLLRQTEESLTELQMSIHPTATEKMFSVLKPNIKSLHSRAERRSDTEL